MLSKGQRTYLGDPLFVKGADEYQKKMIIDNVTREIRSRISDFHNQNVSAYDPHNIDIINTYVWLLNLKYLGI